MDRALCAWLPNWPLQLQQQRQPELHNVPCVVVENSARHGVCVLEASTAAQRRGVRPGMPLAEAQSLCTGPVAHKSVGDHGLHIIQNNPEWNRRVLRDVALECRSFSPTIGLEEGETPDCLLFDITGCGRLFGGDVPLAERLLEHLTQRGYSARVGVADTLGAAWAAAHYRAKPLAVIRKGQHLAALRTLPVAALRLSSSLVRTLHELGVQTIGQLLQLPREALPSRFDKSLRERLDQALGERAEWITPERPEEPIQEMWEIDPPTQHPDTLEHVLRTLVQRVLSQLTPRAEAIRTLQCRWDYEKDRSLLETSFPESSHSKREHQQADGQTILLELVRPCTQFKDIWQLLDLQRERSPILENVRCVQVEVVHTVPLEVRERDVFGNASQEDAWRHTARLIDKLGSRLGVDAVLCPVLVEDAQPERSYHYQRWSDRHLSRSIDVVDSAEASGDTFLSRPTRLEQTPHPLQMIACTAVGTPETFIWKNHTYRVLRAWGPERITTGWWRGGHIRRDYYQVEVSSGHRFWIFLELKSKHWFLHGTFD